MSVYIIKNGPNGLNAKNNSIFKKFPSIIKTRGDNIDPISLAKTLSLYRYDCFGKNNNYKNILYSLNDKDYLLTGLVNVNNTIASGDLFIQNHASPSDNRYFIYNLCKYNKVEKKHTKSPVKLLVDKFKEIVIKDMGNPALYLTVDMKAPLSALILTKLYITEYDFRLDKYKDAYSIMEFKEGNENKKLGKREKQIIKLYNKFNTNMEKREKHLNYKSSGSEKEEHFNGVYKDLFFKIITGGVTL